MIARLYTEDKNRDVLIGIVGQYFNGFSLIPCHGVWKGKQEPGLIIELIFTHKRLIPTILMLVEEIKYTNQQEAVYLVIQKTERAEIL